MCTVSRTAPPPWPIGYVTEGPSKRHPRRKKPADVPVYVMPPLLIQQENASHHAKEGRYGGHAEKCPAGVSRTYIELWHAENRYGITKKLAGNRYTSYREGRMQYIYVIYIKKKV
jgi:hypothetical protein